MTVTVNDILQAGMPSPEALRASSLRWLDRIGPTLIDRWPAELMALSMPTKMVRFPIEIAMTIFDMRGNAPPKEVQEFASELDAAIGWERKFVRLNSRSPKDAMWPFEVPATISGKEALMLFTGSERAIDDLVSFSHIPEQPAYVCLRDWQYGLNLAGEYRCFVKDGELIAVTHYDYTNPWTGPDDGGRELRGQIERWFVEKVKPALPISTVVFDLHVSWKGEFLLIEINPYGLSDPCHLKSYQGVENATGYIAYADTPAPIPQQQNTTQEKT